MKKVFIIILLVLLQFSLIADEVSVTIFKIQHTIKKNDTYSSIIINFLQDKTPITMENKIMKRIILGNPHILTWDKLPIGETINIYIPHSLIDGPKYDLYVASQPKEKNIYKINAINYGFFISTSYAEIDETYLGTEINTTFIPVIGIGNEFVFYHEIPKYKFWNWPIFPLRYSFTAEYRAYEKLQSLDVPGSLNLNFEIAKMHLYKVLSPFMSFSFQTFSNLSRDSTNYRIRENKFVWSTIGLESDFELNHYGLFKNIKYIKNTDCHFSVSYSYAPSFISSSSFIKGAGDSSKISISAHKFILYGEINYKNKYFTRGTFTYFSASGEENLKITGFDWAAYLGMRF